MTHGSTTDGVGAAQLAGASKYGTLSIMRLPGILQTFSCHDGRTSSPEKGLDVVWSGWLVRDNIMTELAFVESLWP